MDRSSINLTQVNANSPSGNTKHQVDEEIGTQTTARFPRTAWSKKNEYINLLYNAKLALDQAEEESPNDLP